MAYIALVGPKTKAPITTIIPSITCMIRAIEMCFTYRWIRDATRSVPPVVPRPKNTRPIPVPCITPPINTASTISPSTSGITGITVSQKDRLTVPQMVFAIKPKPIILIPRKNTGIFSNRLVTPSGIPPGSSGSVTDFTIIAIPLKPPSTIPFVSNADFSAIDISAVPIKISR